MVWINSFASATLLLPSLSRRPQQKRSWTRWIATTLQHKNWCCLKRQGTHQTTATMKGAPLPCLMNGPMSCRVAAAICGQLPPMLLHTDCLHILCSAGAHVWFACACRQYNAMTEDALEDAYSQYIQRQGQRDAAARRRARLQAGTLILRAHAHCTLQQAVRCIQPSTTWFEV